eukprot:1161705-Pelagomonas_calceolata.AAC.6
MSDSRKYTSASPQDFKRSREQHYFGNGVRGHARYIHDMLCASILGTTGHEKKKRKKNYIGNENTPYIN